MQDWNDEQVAKWSAWMDQKEEEFVNGEMQILADEEKAEVVDQQWEDLIGVQFLTFAPEEEYYE